jgi:hypothetical protein
MPLLHPTAEILQEQLQLKLLIQVQGLFLTVVRVTKVETPAEITI